MNKRLTQMMDALRGGRFVNERALTDGQEWSIYLPAEQGTYDERRVYKLDLLERDVAECESLPLTLCTLCKKLTS